MAEVGQAVVSSGGIHPSNEPVPVLQRQVAAHPESAVPDFGSAFSGLALTESALGKISSTIAMQSGVELAKRQGNLLGKTPQGELLPAFTKVDQAFVDSYSAQAKATLGLQANDLINQSQEQISQNYKLNSTSISQFHEQTMKGVQEILKNAPSTIRPELENQYASHIMDSTHQLQLRMISQQKDDAKQQQEVYNNNQVKAAFDSSFQTNTPEGQAQSAQNLESFRQDLQKQRMSGMIDRKTEASMYSAAKLQYYSGVYSRGASDAKAGRNLPEYLKIMHKNLPDDLSESEKITVGNNVMTYVNALHNEEAQDQQLVLSQLNRSLAENTLTGSQIAQAESQLPPTEFNNFMTKLWTFKNTKGQEMAATESLANNISDIYSMAQATDKQKNSAYNALVFKQMQQTPDADTLQVETGVVKGAGGEIPAFTKQLGAMITSGSPDDMYRATRAISSVSSYAPQNIQSLPKEARAMASIFEDLHQVGVNVNDAYAAAREQVLNKTKDQQEANEQSYSEYRKNNLATSDQVQSKALRLLNKPWGASVPDLPAVSNRIMRAWEGYYKLTNGNAAAADKLTAQGLEAAYGTTHVNGAKQFVYLPPEKIAGIGDDAPHIVQNDILRNVRPQLAATFEAFKQNKNDYYYRLSDRNFDEKGPIKVEKVWRGQGKKEGLIEQFNLQATANSNMQLTSNAARPYSGYYDLGLIDKNGFGFPLATVSNTQTHTVGYRPDIQYIRDEYTKYHNNGMTAKENLMQHIDQFIDKHNRGPGLLDKIRAKSAAMDAKELGGLAQYGS